MAVAPRYSLVLFQQEPLGAVKYSVEAKVMEVKRITVILGSS
jgi:hypothetical protein